MLLTLAPVWAKEYLSPDGMKLQLPDAWQAAEPGKGSKQGTTPRALLVDRKSGQAIQLYAPTEGSLSHPDLANAVSCTVGGRAARLLRRQTKDGKWTVLVAIELKGIGLVTAIGVAPSRQALSQVEQVIGTFRYQPQTKGMDEAAAIKLWDAGNFTAVDFQAAGGPTRCLAMRKRTGIVEDANRNEIWLTLMEIPIKGGKVKVEDFSRTIPLQLLLVRKCIGSGTFEGGEGGRISGTLRYYEGSKEAPQYTGETVNFSGTVHKDHVTIHWEDGDTVQLRYIKAW